MNQPRSVTREMALRYGMEPGPFEQTLRATVFPEGGTREQFAAFLLVAAEHGLNPITKEIYAMKGRSGGIQPIVSIDGWASLINRRAELDGIEFVDHIDDDGNISAITCSIWRKDRSKPISVTEYMAECHRDTDTWKRWPRRMLRHKALIQCARYAFAISGIVDPDEYERFTGRQAAAEAQQRRLPPTEPPQITAEVEATEDFAEIANTEEPVDNPEKGPDIGQVRGPLNPEEFIDGMEKAFSELTEEDAETGGMWDQLVATIEEKRAELLPSDYELLMELAKAASKRLSRPPTEGKK